MRLIKKTIAECLRSRVRESADRIALEADKQQYTWRDIDTLSDYMVGRMLSCGIKKGTHVAIWSTNSPNWIIVFLALSKIGAVPVLLNTCYSTEELEKVIRYADAEFVYYGEGYKKLVYEDMVAHLSVKLEGTVKRWIYIGRDTERHWMTEKSFVFAERSKKATKEIGGYIRQVKPEDTAAILFTSGTTAMPKGVMLSHYNLVNSALELCSHMGWAAEDKMLIAVPLFHCFGLTASLLASIHAGCCMHTIEYYKTLTVLKTVQEHRCTLLNGVPSMFLAIIRNPVHTEYDLSSLRNGIIAGSPVSEEEYYAIRREIPGLILHASYGQTETSPCVSISDAADSEKERATTAGRVLRHCEVRILAPDGARLQTGEDGEICVRGYNVMQGYYHLPEETAKTIDADGWLHTGDMGYVTPEGVVFTLTRGSAPRFGFPDGELATLQMENRLADAEIEGIKDEFFVIVPDTEHHHHFLPYLYLVLENGYTVDDVRDAIDNCLDDFMKPVEIFSLPERPFFHFKTDRINLMAQLVKQED